MHRIVARARIAKRRLVETRINTLFSLRLPTGKTKQTGLHTPLREETLKEKPAQQVFYVNPTQNYFEWIHIYLDAQQTNTKHDDIRENKNRKSARQDSKERRNNRPAGYRAIHKTTNHKESSPAGWNTRDALLETSSALLDAVPGNPAIPLRKQNQSIPWAEEHTHIHTHLHADRIASSSFILKTIELRRSSCSLPSPTRGPKQNTKTEELFPATC